MNARNSHLAALGLVRNPFPYTPDAGCYFSTPHLEEQVVELAHCILARKGISLLTAEVGMGKSTLVRRLMADLGTKNVVSALVFNTFLQGPELLAAVLQDFGLQSTGSMSSDIGVLNSFLLDNHREGKTCLLIIDDAQNLSASSLELVRLLCNLETDQEKLLQILLAGQPELEDTLAQHSLRQLRSRLVKHARLYGLNSTEIADYVRFRFESAGSDGSYLLQADACQLLWQETQGVPRQIHLIMDRCLYGLAAHNAKVIDAALMRQAIADSRVELTGVAGVAGGQVPVPAAASGATTAASTGGIPGWTYAVVIVGLLGIGIVLWQQPPRQAQAALTAPVATTSAPIAATPATEDTSAATPGNAVGAEPTTAETTAPAPADTVALAPATGDALPVAAPLPAPAPVIESAVCQPARPWSAERKIVSQPLSETTVRLLGSRLARLDDLCLETREGQTWLSWSAPPAGYVSTDRITAARLQIALTRFGSLTPQEVDGIWGERSRRALQRFQEGVGLPPTGEIDALSGLLLERFYAQES